MCQYFLYPNFYKIVNVHKESVAQLVEWQIRNLKSSSTSWCFWRCCCRIRRIRYGVNSRQLWRTQRQAECRAAWPGTARHGTAPSPPPPLRLYFLAGVTRGANFYGLYYFAFLECALPGVNPRPQFGQCGEKPAKTRHFI